MGAHSSPFIVDKSGDTRESEVRGSVTSPPECDPQPHHRVLSLLAPTPQGLLSPSQTCAGPHCRRGKWSDIHPCARERDGGRDPRSRSLERSQGKRSLQGWSPGGAREPKWRPGVLFFPCGRLGLGLGGSIFGDLSFRIRSGHLRSGLSLRPEVRV